MGWRLSCIALTAPVLVPVVMAANRPPSDGAEADLLALHVAQGLVDARREAAGWGSPRRAMTTTAPTSRTPAMAANSAQPCRWSLA